MKKEHHDRPEARYFDLFLVSGLILLFYTLSGLALGVLVTQGFDRIFQKTAGISLEAVLYYSGIAHLFSLPNSFFSLRSFQYLDLSSLLPFTVAGSVLGLIIAVRYFMRDHERQTAHIKHIDGPKLHEGQPGAKILQRQIAKNFNVDGIKIHPAVQVAERLEIQHLMLVGATGGGKTTVLWQLIDQLIARKDKILAYDVKSDFTQKLKERVILAPWDKRSRRWMIGRDITSEALAQAFAECFIVPNPKATDPVWDNAARALLRAEIHKLMAQKGRNWTFSDLGKGLLEDLLVGVEDPEENMKNLQGFVRTYYAEAYQIVRDATSKATSSVLFTQSGQLSSLIDICRLDAELVKKGAGEFWLDQDSKGFLSDTLKTFPPVILKRAGDSETWSRVFFSALINVCALKINALGDSDPDKRRIWILLDEVPQLGKIPQITTFLETCRSKGVRVALGLQNPEQIDKIYGKEDRATWENNTLTKIWFQDVGKEAKKWASESVGTQTVQVYTKTITRGNLPPSSGHSTTWGEPKEKKLLEEHSFEMILRPKPKFKVVTALLQIAGFDRVVLDWPMITRPVHDLKEKDPVTLPPRVFVSETGEVFAASFGSSPSTGGGVQEEKGREEEIWKKPVTTIKTEHEVVQEEKKETKKEAGEKEEDEVDKVGEKMLTASHDISFSGDPATDSLKLLSAMLQNGENAGSVGKVTIAKSTTTKNEEEEEDREC